MKKLLIGFMVISILFCFSSCANKGTADISSKQTYKEEANESFVQEIAIDDTSEFAIKNPITIDSSKAEKSKFKVDMSINLTDISENGEAIHTKTNKIPINRDYIVLYINNNNEDFTLMCSGFWHLEKFVNGKYEEVKAENSNKECNNSFGPGEYGIIGCDLKPYTGLIEKGKYRIISPTLNILKETENGLEEFTYENEKVFILYSEFEFVDEDKTLNTESENNTSSLVDDSKRTSSRK
ncbi:MAG: hypothetical protein IJE01_01145 [Clostridia bacterium]|nr:hypothetical protein [Clostridia bacterium]